MRSGSRMIHWPDHSTPAMATTTSMDTKASAPQTAAEHELAQLLVESLNIDWVKPADIDPDAALFGSDLGLDSIDALELALAVSKRYGFQLRSDNPDNKRIFGSLRALSAHIQQQKSRD